VDPHWFAPAHWGLELFFALSGYLIVGQWVPVLASGSPVMLRSFCLKRFFRTLPTYWIILLLLVFAMPGAEKAQLWLRNAFFLDTFPFASRGLSSVLAVNWSLAVEELSYVIFIVLGLFFLRVFGGRGSVSRPRTCAWLVMILLIVTANIFRFAAIGNGFSVDQIKFSALLQIDALAFGGMAWLIRDQCGRPRSASWILCVVLIVALVPWLGYEVRSVYVHGISALGSGYAFLVKSYVLSRFVCALVVYLLASCWFTSFSSTVLWSRTVGEVARSSYSTYLLHHSLVLPLVGSVAGELGGITFLSYLVMSFMVGSLGYIVLERPWLIVRRRVLSGLGRQRGVSQGAGAE
jgi:peptidoglycan/LPS O-acetylase OafA/YrhL